jgi:predicted ArsR family transcriptional regulator
MALETTTTAQHRALADEQRASILAELEAAPAGLDASEIGRRLGRHANTIRWHLGILARAGIVRSDAEPRSAPGRPRILYRLGSSITSGRSDEYRLLAAVLADTVSKEERGTEECELAGRVWGAELVGGRDADGNGVDAVVEILAEQGFEPHAEELAIRMCRCPFHDLAEAHPEVVCAVHRGLISGALEALGSDLSVSALEIFPQPNVCVARLGDRRGASPR